MSEVKPGDFLPLLKQGVSVAANEKGFSMK